MAFAVGLAIFGGALTTGLRAYVRTVANEQQQILDRISLESAVSERLGRLTASGGIGAEAASQLVINGRTVGLELSSPASKLDLNGDTDDALMQALAFLDRDAGYRATLSNIDTLDQLAREWRLGPDEEDCIRRAVTAGRAPGPFHKTEEGAPNDLVQAVSVGDQLDVRVAVASPASLRVGWFRARMTGQPAQPWRLQDYRVLRLQGRSNKCPGRP